MAIVKMVCQGCGANLDVRDDQRIFECGYCGITNHLQATATPKPPPPKPPPAAVVYAPPPMPSAAHSYPTPPAPPNTGKGRKIILIIVLAAVMMPLAIGVFITVMVAKVASDTLDATLGHLDKAGIGRGGGPLAERYMWINPRPHLADLDGDGHEDIIGLIQPLPGDTIVVAAFSGANHAQLWAAPIGARSEFPQPELRFDAEQALVLLELGSTLRAFAGADGSARWTATLPDAIDSVVHEGEQLWVHTIDDSLSTIALADGARSPAEGAPGPESRPLLGDGGYELIPSHPSLDLASNQFEGVRVERGFCPPAQLELSKKARRGRGKAGCAHDQGLAYVTRAKGSKIPLLLGYAGADKSERWRTQLSEAGSLTTVEGGFDQPRAELTDTEAFVSFKPQKAASPQLRSVSLADGTTRWEQTLTTTSAHVNAIVVGEAIVVVSMGQELRVLSRADGSERARLGGVR